jgi:hypothetical protein
MLDAFVDMEKRPILVAKVSSQSVGERRASPTVALCS